MGEEVTHLRNWLRRTCFNTTALRALLQDEFFDVAQELPPAASMSQMLNALFETYPADQIAARLASRGYARASRGCELLLVTADPNDRPPLRTAAEVRAIEEVVSSWNTEVVLNAQFSELVDAMTRHRPRVLHFSGHGDDNSKNMLFVDAAGNARPIDKKAFTEVVGAHAPDLVVLSACFSHEQAVALRTVVPCAIGMTRRVSHDAAIAFSRRLYALLGRGEPVRVAFDQAKASLAAAADAPHEDHVPRITWSSNVDEHTFTVSTGRPREHT